MTGRGLVNGIFIEPIISTLESIIEKEKPDLILSTIGGQTALNMAIKLHKHGELKKYGVKFIGVSIDPIN